MSEMEIMLQKNPKGGVNFSMTRLHITGKTVVLGRVQGIGFLN